MFWTSKTPPFVTAEVRTDEFGRLGGGNSENMLLYNYTNCIIKNYLYNMYNMPVVNAVQYMKKRLV